MGLTKLSQLIPQIVINYRRHNTIGLQPSMMMLWAWAGVPLGVYNIVEDFNIALRIQPQILTLLSLITWIQCFYYEKHWSVLHALAVVVPVALVMGGIQAAVIIGLRIAKSRHVQWPITLMAVLAAALLAAGVLRHYWDIYVHRTVRGISFIFVAIDAAGDLFSLISVFFQPKLDILGMFIYGTELILWIGVFACGGYYNLLPWIRRRLGKSESRQSSEEDERQNNPARDTPGTARDINGIALHDMPSSTSVFRTPSGEIAFIRARTSDSRRAVDHTKHLQTLVIYNHATNVIKTRIERNSPTAHNMNAQANIQDRTLMADYHAPPSFSSSSPTSPSSLRRVSMPRPRAESSASTRQPGPPMNTPDALSLAGDTRSLNLDAVNADLTEEPDIAYGDPTLVPENTPASNTPASHFRFSMLNLPSIDEALELLPPPVFLSSAYLDAGSSSVTSPRAARQHREDFLRPRSSCTEPIDEGEQGVISVAIGSPRFVSASTDESAGSHETVHPGRVQPPVAPIPVDGGVPEHNDWQEDIEQDVDRDLARLANLAEDDHHRDPSQDPEQHYRRRLTALLNGPSRKYVFGDLGPVSVAGEGSAIPIPSDTVPATEFERLQRRVDALTNLVIQMAQTQMGGAADSITTTNGVAEESRTEHKSVDGTRDSA
ncbi:hypothetical protein H2199_000740 [Coniosporium tulheliwenetii]|uniref:Uncharacterized protein n=1 Tax=Coniosporium tulheliwenetii TaxID=3383036 RepID=A0ACC2ZMV5_9PEZI|nr:hypothetical protein H2199_000740 [Cladosporium sp. JES 115]